MLIGIHRPAAVASELYVPCKYPDGLCVFIVCLLNLWPLKPQTPQAPPFCAAIKRHTAEVVKKNHKPATRL